MTKKSKKIKILWRKILVFCRELSGYAVKSLYVTRDASLVLFDEFWILSSTLPNLDSPTSLPHIPRKPHSEFLNPAHSLPAAGQMVRHPENINRKQLPRLQLHRRRRTRRVLHRAEQPALPPRTNSSGPQLPLRRETLHQGRRSPRQDDRQLPIK